MVKEKYCEHCGKPLGNDGKCGCVNVTKKTDIYTGKQGGRKIPSKAWVILAVVLLVATVLGTLLAGTTKKINLAQYLDNAPDYIGINGHATVNVSSLFDGSQLESDLLEMMDKNNANNLDKMSEKELQKLMTSNGEYILECETALDDIVVTIWKNDVKVEELTELSNGDVIKVEVKSLNPTNRYLKVRFEAGAVNFTVKGLVDGQALDAFESANLNVSFTGTNGNGSAHLDYEATIKDGLSVDFMITSTDGDLSNGDKVEVTVKYDKEEWETKGYYPAEETKDYTVEGLNNDLSALEQIPEEQLELMKADAEAALMKEVEQWIDGVSVENMTYLGSYLLNRKKDHTGLGASNCLYLVYQVDVFENFSPFGGDDAHFSYYVYSAYEGLVLDADGKLDLNSAYRPTCWDTVIRNVKTASNILEVYKDLSYTGHESLDALYEDCVGSILEDYTYVTDIQMD